MKYRLHLHREKVHLCTVTLLLIGGGGGGGDDGKFVSQWRDY